MTGCSATWCKNSSSKGFTMLRFPKDPKTRAKWTAICRREKNWTPTESSRLCHAHFPRKQWIVFRVRLKERQAPMYYCVCSLKEDIETGQGDHSYCKKFEHDADCFKLHENSDCDTDLEVSDDEVAVELCKMKQVLADVTSKVVLCENTIAAFSLMKKAEEDSRDVGYSPQQIKDGLKLWFAGGTSGYSAFLKVMNLKNIRFPCVRTLQQRTEHIKFMPGVQLEILEALKVKLNHVSDPRDKDCSLFFDAMAIKQALDFDIGNGSFLGHITLPGVVEPEVLASKGEVWMFGGIRTKWKQLVAWHLTSDKEHPKEKSLIVRDLLKRGYDCGLNVIAIVCDMGNRGLLREMGFTFKKKNMTYRIANPTVQGAKLWVVPDVIHVFKSMKEMLSSNKVLLLNRELCKEFNLPFREVKLDHILWLEEFQRGQDLKFVPKLKLTDLNTPHYSKMKVRSAYLVFGSKTAAALSWLCQRGLVPVPFETTAWFIKLMDRWREIMTARTLVNALGTRNMKAFKEAVAVLKLVCRVFRTMSVHGKWKPVQTHLIMATESMLEICTFLLVERGYDFVLLGRFLQDIVENLFSVVRMQRPVPSPVQFKYRLKQCALSQFNQEIKGASYDFADTEDFVDLLLDQHETHKKNGTSETSVIDISKYTWHDTVPAGFFAVGQEDILYKVSGFPVKKLTDRNILKCPLCIAKLKHPDPKNNTHPCSALLKEAERKEGCMVTVSDKLFEMFRLTEYNLRRWKITLSESCDSFHPLVQEHILPSVARCVDLETCHDVLKVLVPRFVWMRLKQLTLNLTEAMVDNSKVTSQLSSKTAGEKHLSNNFTPKRKKAIESNSMKRLRELP